MTELLRRLALGAGLLLLLIGCHQNRSLARPKSNEAKITLGAISSQMEIFAEEFDRYVTIPPHPPLPEAKGMAVKREWTEGECKPACSRARFEDCGSFACLGYRPAGRVYYSYACEAVKVGGVSDFTCAAIADLDGDGAPGVFVYGTNHNKGPNLVAPLPAFARGYGCSPGVTPARELVECNLGKH